MNIDYATHIGKTHHTCEDYVMGFNKGVQLALSDGCSSSLYSDVGARLLVWQALETMNSFYNNVSYNGFAEQLIFQLQKPDCVPISAYDATLITALPDGYCNNIVIRVYGDGNIIQVHEDESFTWMRIGAYNFPYYLAYRMDQSRRRIYKEEVTSGVTVKLHGVGVQSVKLRSYDDPLEFIIPIEDTKYIIISSDGIESFVDINNGEKIPTLDVIKKIIDFRNPTGEFVKRRLKNLVETYTKDRIFNMDDLSLGVIAV
jgi:hypothetical protein